jgi:hypothetical protein
LLAAYRASGKRPVNFSSDLNFRLEVGVAGRRLSEAEEIEFTSINVGPTGNARR